MKITKKQLKKIILEMLDEEHPSDVEPVEDAWSGDIEGTAKNLELDIDHSKAVGSEATTKSPESLPAQEPLLSENELRRIVRRELMLLEYEQYVDAEGNIYDDEGNVSRRGAAFGQKYGGETYLGTSPPWRRRKNIPPMAGSVRGKQLAAIEDYLSVKTNNFLQSLADQMKSGRRMSDKQVAVMKKILVKHDPKNEELF